MPVYEYKVIPAPAKGRKAKGVKTPEACFALVLQDTMNAEAANGWEYQRSDILPSEERQGLTSSHTVYRSVLVFRRALPSEPDVTADETAADVDTDPRDGADTTSDASDMVEDAPAAESESTDQAEEEDQETLSEDPTEEAPSSEENSETDDETKTEDDTASRS